MTNVNVIYGAYDDKVNGLYDKEFALNESLSKLISDNINDMTMLYDKYEFKTNLKDILNTLQTKAKSHDDSTFVRGFKLNDYTLDIADVEHKKYKLLTFKIKLLYTLYIRHYHSTVRLTKYKNMKMPYYSFNYLNTAVNVEMTKSILRGYPFSFGLECVNMGKIKVEEVERRFDEEGYPTDRSINWDESKKFKQALIDQNIPVYNKDTCPNGTKWFIYHTEPYIYYINWVISIWSHKFIKLFKFEPTAFINTKNRNSADVLDNYNVDVEDIINNPKLGFVTKLNILLKKDPSYALTYR